jgi:hypothetical protein
MLEQVAQLTNTPIIVDAFRTARVQAHDLRLRLEFVVEDLSSELWLRWDKSGYLLGRHQRYWERRPAEMPEAWLRPLEEKYRQRTLELWDYVELAGKMTQEQIDSLYYVDQPLTQFDLTPLQDCLLALRFLASLNATQRQAFASGAWLPAAQLTPPQQQRFAEALGDRFPPLQQLFREPIPPVDIQLDHGLWRSRRGDPYLESHVEETDAQSEPTQLPDAPAVRLKKYPNKVVYGLVGEREAVYTEYLDTIRERLTEIPDGKLFADTYQVSVIEFTAPNRQPKRYLFALEYHEPYTLPARRACAKNRQGGLREAMKTLSPPVEVAPTRKATLLECLLAAVASGALLAFALPPFDVPLLGFVALAPMMAAVLRASAIPALVSTLLTGIVAGTVMTAFLSGVGDGFGSPTLALAYFAVFGVAMWFPLMGARVLGAGRAGAIVLGVGALGVLTEWLAARLDYPFTLALVLWRDAPLLWVAGWVGVWGLSFLAWATNAALALAVMERRLNAPLKALAGGLLALHLLGWLQHALIREGETLRVAVVQWEGDYAPLIAQAKAQGAQLVVLPEACCSTRGVALGAADAGVAHLRRIPRGQRGDACRA